MQREGSRKNVSLHERTTLESIAETPDANGLIFVFCDGLKYRMPATGGGIFVVDKQWFMAIGSYDEQMEIWGCDNIGQFPSLIEVHKTVETKHITIGCAKLQNTLDLYIPQWSSFWVLS